MKASEKLIELYREKRKEYKKDLHNLEAKLDSIRSNSRHKDKLISLIEWRKKEIEEIENYIHTLDCVDDDYLEEINKKIDFCLEERKKMVKSPLLLNQLINIQKNAIVFV